MQVWVWPAVSPDFLPTTSSCSLLSRSNKTSMCQPNSKNNDPHKIIHFFSSILFLNFLLSRHMGNKSLIKLVPAVPLFWSRVHVLQHASVMTAAWIQYNSTIHLWLQSTVRFLSHYFSFFFQHVTFKIRTRTKLFSWLSVLLMVPSCALFHRCRQNNLLKYFNSI